MRPLRSAWLPLWSACPPVFAFAFSFSPVWCTSTSTPAGRRCGRRLCLQLRCPRQQWWVGATVRWVGATVRSRRAGSERLRSRRLSAAAAAVSAASAARERAARLREGDTILELELEMEMTWELQLALELELGWEWEWEWEWELELEWELEMAVELEWAVQLAVQPPSEPRPRGLADASRAEEVRLGGDFVVAAVLLVVGVGCAPLIAAETH